MRARGRGTTLIELLVALLVVGVLASLALPSYRRHLLRTHRIEATGALLALAAAQERFYLQHDRYATQAELAPAPPDGLGAAASSREGRYSIEIASADAAGFTATATAVGAQSEDAACAQFHIESSGARGATDRAGQAAPQCWR